MVVDRWDLKVFGDGDADYLIETTRSRRATVADDRRINRAVYVIGRAALIVGEERGTTELGGEYEREICWVLRVDAGLIDLIEVFSTDDLATALAARRARGCGTDRSTDPVDGERGVRFMEPLRAAFNAKDRDALRG